MPLLQPLQGGRKIARTVLIAGLGEIFRAGANEVFHAQHSVRSALLWQSCLDSRSCSSSRWLAVGVQVRSFGICIGGLSGSVVVRPRPPNIAERFELLSPQNRVSQCRPPPIASLSKSVPHFSTVAKRRCTHYTFSLRSKARFGGGIPPCTPKKPPCKAVFFEHRADAALSFSGPDQDQRNWSRSSLLDTSPKLTEGP